MPKNDEGVIFFPVDRLDRLVESFQGRAGCYIKDVKTGSSYVFHENDRFPTASIFKLLVMVSLFRMAELGRVNLEDRRRLSPDISEFGSGSLKILKDSPELSIRD